MQAAKLHIDNDMQALVRTAIVDTFNSMLGLEPKLKSVETSKPGFAKYEISGVIGFIQGSLEGTLTLGFNRKTVAEMLSKFYGEPIDFADEKLAGGVGELTNIVFGIIKEYYNDVGFDFRMCLPVVIVGDNHSIFSTISSVRMQMIFTTELGEISAEIATLSDI